MVKPKPSAARQLAEVAHAFEKERTGHEPDAVTVVLCGQALVITLHGALSAAEISLAKDPSGAAQLQEFHQQLFANAAPSLKAEVERITGAKVRESMAELDPGTGMVTKVFTTGSVVQVFLLANPVAADDWTHGHWPGDEPVGV